jgi:transposase
MQPMCYIRLDVHKRKPSATAGCVAEKSAGNTVQRTPLSKQRNKHLQTTLVEAAKMAPRYSPNLAMLYDRENQMPIASRWR